MNKEEIIEESKKLWYINAMQKLNYNLVDVIAASCGWNPLTKEEEMTVTFDDKQYMIKRIK